MQSPAAHPDPNVITDIAVIIVNYRTPDLALDCARAIDRQRPGFSRLRTIIVEGGSGDGSAEKIGNAIGDLVDTEMLALPVNGGFAYANNCAMQHLAAANHRPNAILLINPDARPREGAIAALATLLSVHPAIGAVGARLEHEDGRPQGCAFTFPSLRGEFCRGASTGLFNRLLRVPPSTVSLDEAGSVPWVTGAAVMFRTAALEQTGLFDDGFFLYFEETELLHRLRRHGWDIWHEPAARVVHHGGVATQIRDPETGLPLRRRTPAYWYESRRRFFTLCRGPGYALMSGLAYLAGRVVGKLRSLAGRKQDSAGLRASRDLIRFGLWPTRRDCLSAIRRFGDEPRPSPAWMDRAS